MHNLTAKLVASGHISPTDAKIVGLNLPQLITLRNKAIQAAVISGSTTDGEKEELTVLNDAIKRLDGQSRYEYDAENFRLIRRDGNGEVNLSNMYDEHCSLPRKEMPGNIRRLASIFADSAAASVLTMIVDRSRNSSMIAALVSTAREPVTVS